MWLALFLNPDALEVMLISFCLAMYFIVDQCASTEPLMPPPSLFFSRLLCALEGNYLVEENTHDSMDSLNTLKENDELQCINFSCSIPAVNGRGFIEVLFSSISYHVSWSIAQPPIPSSGFYF